MQDPPAQIRHVVRSITEPFSSQEMLRAVDRYFTLDSVIVHPMFNSPPALGRDGLRSSYKMLRVLTINNKILFHAVAFDDSRKDEGRQTCLMDITEKLELRLIPKPLRTTISIRFFISVELRKEADGLWRIAKQIDNLPSDLGMAVRGRLFGVVNAASDVFKQACGYGTWLIGSTLARYGLL